MITLFLTIEVRAEKQRTNTPLIYIKLREQIITMFELLQAQQKTEVSTAFC